MIRSSGVQTGELGDKVGEMGDIDVGLIRGAGSVSERSSTAKHILYNLVGLGAPLVVAVISVPQLVIGLGATKFGLLTLVWALVGYLGLFDLGLGRALTQRLAMLRGVGEIVAIPSLVATAITLLTVLGVVAGVALAGFGPAALRMIKDGGDSVEGLRALYALAFAMPAIILTTGFRGILEANGAFAVINLIRIPMGFFTYLGPLAVLFAFGPRLDLIALVLATGRILACVAHGVFAFRGIERERNRFQITVAHAWPLCTTGGWMTLSNIISPFMGYVDRFMVGTMVSAAAVAYYATPNELVTKLWIIPGALTSVLFPMLSRIADRDPDESWRMLQQAVKWLFIAIMPVALGLALFAHEILAVWIGSSFADQSARVLQLLCIGILINCLAHVPLTTIQAFNRPKLVAMLHAAEFPLFIVALWAGVHFFGVIGAAMAWLGRMIFDTIALFLISARLSAKPWSSLVSGRLVLMAVAVAVAFACALSASWWLRIPVVLVSLAPLLYAVSRYAKQDGVTFANVLNRRAA
jgi:O-antigen/teichoic acid export membrane protein